MADSLEDIREQLNKNCLYGDAMSVSKYLLEQYDSLVEKYELIREHMKTCNLVDIEIGP